jgi:hypothetical protein
VSPHRISASWLLAGSLAFLLIAAPLARADVVFDNFDAGDTFSPTANLGAAYAQRMSGSVVAIRAAAEFTVTGGDYLLDSITLPISFSSNNATGNFLRVRIALDNAGAPGPNLETLTEDQPLWPPMSTPFTTKTIVGSVNHPLLSNGGSYWIVTEPTAIPSGDPSTVDYRWFQNTGGVTVPGRQQQATGGLPANPWTGFSGPVALAFRVDGQNAVGVGTGGPPSSPALQASPTPFRSTTRLTHALSRSGPAQLTIFSLDGRRVRELERGVRPAGVHDAEWNGRDDAGRGVPAGLYLARLDGPDGRFVRRVVLIP